MKEWLRKMQGHIRIEIMDREEERIKYLLELARKIELDIEKEINRSEESIESYIKGCVVGDFREKSAEFRIMLHEMLRKEIKKGKAQND